MAIDFIYQCVDCGAEYGPQELIYLCPACSKHQADGKPPVGVLKLLYSYERIRSMIKSFQQLKEERYLSVLPISSAKSLPNLRIGDTPLYKKENLEGEELPFSFFLKDDAQNPTFSFKDRASALVSAFARERGFDTLVAASTGNAGSSLAGICANQGQKAVIIVPETAPIAKLTQIMMYGAKLVPVKGNYDQAFDVSIRATAHFGWYNRNTAYNPLTIEGKKTVAFELFDQLGQQLPDRVFVPVGDGVILSGVYKGFEDLMLLGFTDRMPCIVAVQSSGSDNLVRNLTGGFDVKPSHTIADSISVDIPRNFNMAKQFIGKYAGEALSVDDDAILHASAVLARETGIFTEPASAAAFAALLYFKETKLLPPGSCNVVLLTGSGLKDLNAMQPVIKMPQPIDPGPGAVKQISSQLKYL